MKSAAGPNPPTGAPLPLHLAAQLDFLLTCDRLKHVTRTTLLRDGSRAENSAEHSWHLALMALSLAEYAPSGTHLPKVIELLLVHDLVEIHAGDTHFDIDAAQQERQAQAEAQAARTLFSRLPDQQAAQFEALWHEFEAQLTPEARYAKALDALQPMLLTWGPGALGCRALHPELSAERVLALKAPNLSEFPALWHLARRVVAQAVEKGILDLRAT